MANVLMTKPGQTSILVNTAAVAAHQAAGWSPAVISISADGQSLIIPYGTYLDVQNGMFKLNSVQLTASSAELDTLDIGTNEAALVHYSVAPAAVAAANCMAATNLSASTQNVAAGLSNPDVPRTVTIVGNVSGITGNVVVSGANINGVAITDTIALNGTSTVEGVKAFKTVTNVALPVQTHTPVQQVETATVVGTCTGSGNLSCIVTGAGIAGSPLTVSVPVLNSDTAAQMAAKVITALQATGAVTALYTVGGSTVYVVLTAISPAANDATLNIETKNGTCTGVTDTASSANTTAGVPYDTVSLGVAKKLGMPHVIAQVVLVEDVLFNGSADGGTMAVNANVEQNLYPLQGTPDGAKIFDAYYFV